MKKTVLSLAAALGLIGFGFAASPATALPVAPVQQVDAGSGNLVDVQMTRRERMMRRNMMRSRTMRRGRMMRRGSMMRRGAMMGRGGVMSTRRVMRGGDPNARSPSRGPGAQQTGNTSGGPRY